MASKVAKAAHGGIRAWLMPEINDIKVQLAEMRGDIKSLNTKIDATNERIASTNERIASTNERMDSLRNELKSDISRVDSSLKAEIRLVDNSVKDMDKRLDIAARLGVIEAKQREFEKKLSGQ